MNELIEGAFNEYEVIGVYNKSNNHISLISGDLLCEWYLSSDKLIKKQHGHKVTHLLNKVYVISQLNQIYSTREYDFEFQEAFLYFFALKMLNIKLDLDHNNMFINHFKDDINPLDDNPNVKLTIK